MFAVSTVCICAAVHLDADNDLRFFAQGDEGGPFTCFYELQVYQHGQERGACAPTW